MNVSTEAELPQTEPRTVPPALLALVAPETGMERQARIGTAKLAFLVAFLCAFLSAFAQSSRIDARATTLARLDKDGKLTEMSDKQVDDEAKSDERLAQVKIVAAGVFKAPVSLGFGALSVVFLVWFLKGKIKGRAVVPVAAAALLPGAIASVLDAVSAFSRSAIPADKPVLAPRDLAAVLAALGNTLQGPALKLASSFDFFSLWGAILLGFGVHFAGDVPMRRALTGTLVAWTCWRLLTTVAVGG
ncbi:MAG TPA: hypothetical protein VH083_11280 [Myxococcales bacterium]|nr:hypothetical protein [Myxococcales bacterium]